MAPSSPKMARDGPNMAQDGPKLAQDGPKMAQDGPKMAPSWPKMAQDGPEMALRCPKIPPFLLGNIIPVAIGISPLSFNSQNRFPWTSFVRGKRVIKSLFFLAKNRVSGT